MPIDERALEAACRAIAAHHYAERFGKARTDPHVRMNVDGNWPIFAHDARLAIGTYQAALAA